MKIFSIPNFIEDLFLVISVGLEPNRPSNSILTERYSPYS